MIVNGVDDGAQEVVVPVTLASMLEAPEPVEEVVEEVVLEGTAEEIAAAALLEGEQKVEKVEVALEKAEEQGLPADEIGELRTLLREMRNENLRLKVRLEKVEGVQNNEVGAEAAPGVLEALQNSLNDVAVARQESFTTLLEAMELNPKFEDVRTVCSAGNFNDIFEAVATSRAQEAGTSFDEELMKAKIEVWKMPNPYRYMYETIKEYHPSFKQVAKAPAAPAPVAKTAKEILAAAQAAGRAPKPADAPGSIAGLSGSATEQGGWTAAKIDSLSESELRTVPRDIYSKWLSGELD